MSDNHFAATVAPSLTVRDVVKALEFYAEAFGAEESFRLDIPDGPVVHAEFSIGDTGFYISTESEEWRAIALEEGQLAPCLFCIRTDNCDEAYEKAVSAGAESIEGPTDQIWGSRTAVVSDAFGYRWSFGQVIEEVSPEEMKERIAKMMAGESG